MYMYVYMDIIHLTSKACINKQVVTHAAEHISGSSYWFFAFICYSTHPALVHVPILPVSCPIAVPYSGYCFRSNSHQFQLFSKVGWLLQQCSDSMFEFYVIFVLYASFVFHSLSIEFQCQFSIHTPPVLTIMQWSMTVCVIQTHYASSPWLPSSHSEWFIQAHNSDP